MRISGSSLATRTPTHDQCDLSGITPQPSSRLHGTPSLQRNQSALLEPHAPSASSAPVVALISMSVGSSFVSLSSARPAVPFARARSRARRSTGAAAWTVRSTRVLGVDSCRSLPAARWAGGAARGWPGNARGARSRLLVIARRLRRVRRSGGREQCWRLTPACAVHRSFLRLSSPSLLHVSLLVGRTRRSGSARGVDTSITRALSGGVIIQRIQSRAEHSTRWRIATPRPRGQQQQPLPRSPLSEPATQCAGDGRRIIVGVQSQRRLISAVINSQRSLERAGQRRHTTLAAAALRDQSHKPNQRATTATATRAINVRCRIHNHTARCQSRQQRRESRWNAHHPAPECGWSHPAEPRARTTGAAIRHCICHCLTCRCRSFIRVEFLVLWIRTTDLHGRLAFQSAAATVPFALEQRSVYAIVGPVDPAGLPRTIVVHGAPA